ncbi:MAG: exodeoxyribonuclease V subunit alpha [Gammaproteobacteria bacterium]|jgi:exodeoxyribonuclease V alpha subunit
MTTIAPAPDSGTDTPSAFLKRAQHFLKAGVLDASDVHAIALTAPRFGEDDVERMLGLAFAARAPRVSHPGVDLRTLRHHIDVEADEELPWPADPEAWAAHTLGSPMVGGPDDQLKPFVAQPQRQPLTGASPDARVSPLLLTRRMYVEQQRVARAVVARAAHEVPEAARVADLDATLARLFPVGTPGQTGGTDGPDGEAARAVRLAATQRLALIVGGPGTGKTFSVTRLLAALMQGRAISVALAAPTGKAAARMREAIREATDAAARPLLDVSDDVRARLQSLPATTLHRLVGVRPDGSARHTAANPIPAQLVIVDEVSMVDLTMMRRLLEAVHPEARLVLLGDRDQLASVEAGCVLADLVPPARGPASGVAAGSAPDAAATALAAVTQMFTRSRRFESAPDIALIAACLQSYPTRHPDVPAGDPQAIRARALEVFNGTRHASQETQPDWRIERLGAPVLQRVGTGVSKPVAKPTEQQLAQLVEPYLNGYATVLRAGIADRAQLDDPKWQRDLLAIFDRYRVLAVHRRGPLGVQQLEQELARRLRAAFDPRGRQGDDLGYGHWVGRPILITENAYDVGLMNGDVGIVLPLADGAAAVFPHETPGEVRRVALSRLPPHEGALVMTVHKSQGSQFDHVALVLAGRDSPIQTRELVYTGVTRAKQRLSWLGDVEELRKALEREVRRESGLPELIGSSLG